MKRTSPEILDYYDEEVVRRIVEKYGYDEREALENAFADLDRRFAGTQVV